MSQKDMIRNHLVDVGDISTAEANTVYSITRLAARIGELRNEGLDIETVMHQDRRGRSFARYYLDAAPF